MKIVSWNCHASSPEKIRAILSTEPDIAILPECSSRETSTLKAEGLSVCWVGNVKSKGLGVFSHNGWELQPLAPTSDKFFGAVAFQVNGPVTFTLVAVWTQPTKSFGHT